MMNNGQHRVQMCMCDGRYDGCTHGRTCPEPGGGQWSRYFCADCDPRRMDHISEGLKKIQQPLAGESS